jgi:hemerythrin-like metal-binding protein
MLDQVNLSQLQGISVGDIHDREHFEIKWKTQHLRMAILEGKGIDKIIADAKELIVATLEHFKSEESAMDADTLRNFTTHRRLHTDIIQSLRDISNDLEQRRIRGAIELIKFFDVSLTNHLDVEDAAFERELRNVK